MSAEQVESAAELDVQNIGGIEETSVIFDPGVTVLAGRNATNRTSLLQAVMSALGSDNVSIKADAEEAHVELILGGETYTRTLEHRNGTIAISGEPYLEDSTVADLFAFLLESNDARRAVVTNGDLRASLDSSRNAKRSATVESSRYGSPLVAMVPLRCSSVRV